MVAAAAAAVLSLAAYSETVSVQSGRTTRGSFHSAHSAHIRACKTSPRSTASANMHSTKQSN